MNHLAVVEILLKAGANPALRTTRGHTAFDLAEMLGHRDIANLLEPLSPWEFDP
jgi:ankyrin repeat protein